MHVSSTLNKGGFLSFLSLSSEARMDQEIEGTGSPFWSGSGYYQSQANQTAVLGRTSSSESAASSTVGATNRGVKKTWTVVLFLVFSILLLLFLSSFRSMAFRQTVVKSGWESLNIAFLLFAVICGFLGRNKVEDAGVGSGKLVHSPPYTPRLKRSSSSYPDLKEPQQWSFADDLGLYGRERKWDAAGVDRTEEDDDEEEIKSMVVHRNLRDSDFKNVRVDVVLPKLPAVKRSNVESPPEKKKIRSPSPPPPPPLPRSTPSRGRTHDGSKVKITPEKKVKTNVDGPPPPPPLPPPSPPPAMSRKDKRSQRKRSGGTKDIATAIAAYYQKKRKRNGNGSSKGKRSYDDFLLTSVPSQPPPPPPLPQMSALYHFFRNKKETINTKSKQIYSTTQSPSATHLPPPATSQIVTVHRPPLPPPLPQRNVPPEIAAVPLSPEPAPFCPSSDVNNKADLFIARLHAGWRLEKLKSIKEKENQQQ